jgi:hypothetical protein
VARFATSDVSNAVGPHLVDGLKDCATHTCVCIYIYIYQYDAEIIWIGCVTYELSYVLEVLEVVGVGGCVWTISFYIYVYTYKGIYGRMYRYIYIYMYISADFTQSQSHSRKCTIATHVRGAEIP